MRPEAEASGCLFVLLLQVRGFRLWRRVGISSETVGWMCTAREMLV